MGIKDFFRFYKILSLLLHYGVDEVVIDFTHSRSLKLLRYSLFWIRNRHKDKPLGERLKLVFEVLGPVWIKLGQMLSTRRDLFSVETANQLALLQDNVNPFDGQIAKQLIEDALGGPIETWFSHFDIHPLASASIAQVHTAQLKTTQADIVIKIIRPHIEEIISADIKLMYRLARWLPRLLPDGQRLRATEVVKEYEKTLLGELDLTKEAANTMRLRGNFLNSPMLYIPFVYQDFCRKNVLVTERIYGIPVSDIEALRANGTNFKLLAERGVQTFFTQVFRDSFFHADMHPGNIFISREHPDDPQYIGIDCGIVGILNDNDKRYLAENFLAFFNRDYRRISELYIYSGWVPPDTDINEFEEAIRQVCEPVFAKPLSEISFGHMLVNLFQTARHFNMEIQPQLVLLEKTLLYIEGLGRQLYPELDLWTTAKPFLEKWIQEQIGIKSMLHKIKKRMPYWSEKLPELPDLLYDGLKQQQLLSHKTIKLLEDQNKRQKNRFTSLVLTIIGATLIIASSHFITHGVINIGIYLTIIGIGIWIIAWSRVK